jgi:hypothetical protein
VPPALNAVTASSVTAPNSSVPGSIPSASGVTPPNSSVPGSVPSSSGVTPPGSSPGTGTGVTPPGGGGTVTPLGNYNPFTGKCEDRNWGGKKCDTSQTLENEAKDKEDQAKNATGDAERQRALLELARLNAILESRKALGNDRYADTMIDRLEQSSLYESLETNPVAKTMFWMGLARGMMTGEYRKQGMSAKTYLEKLVNSADHLKYTGRNANGVPQFVEVNPKPPSKSGFSNSNANTNGIPINPVTVGMAAVATMLVGSTATDGYSAGARMITDLLNIGGQLLSEEVKKIETAVEDKKKLEDYLGGASPVKVGDKAEQREKPGGQTQADKDFENLVDPGSIRDLPGGVRIGTTPSGQTVVLRPSNEGSPTIELPGIGPDGKPIKVRYR